MRFGFIGAGNMASAIIRGMTIGTKSYDGKDIFITSKSGTSAQRLAETCGATAVTTAAEVVAASDVLVLAVKPHILAAVLPALKEEIAAKKPLVVSIAAGKELAYLAELLPEGTPVVRIMPNINAKIGAATSGLCANALVTAEQKAVVKEMFATIGAVIEVEESQFGIFTVLAGSCPCVRLSLYGRIGARRSQGRHVQKAGIGNRGGNRRGRAKMVLESGEHPMSLVDQVCSPGRHNHRGCSRIAGKWL